MTRRKRWSIYGGIVCVIVVAQLIFLSTITSPYPDVRQPPAEANRVVHPTGFSIVKPGLTRAIVTSASSVSIDQITILPDGGRSRYTPGLYASRLREPPDLSRLQREGFQAGSFQEQAALVYRGPSGKYDAYRVMMNRGGEWYEVSLLIPGGDRSPASIPSPEWQRYLETFQPAAAPTIAFREAAMKRLVPLALVVVLGCASYSNRSTIMDPQAFPPGHYGLYERKSDQLVLTCELRQGETFGFEYTGKRPSGLEISRIADERDGSRERIWRLPLSPGDYEWKPIAPAAVVSSHVPRAR